MNMSINDLVLGSGIAAIGLTILAVIVLSIGPALYHLLREERFRRAAKKKIIKIFRYVTLCPKK